MTAFGLYRGHFGAVVLTAALALAPAMVVMSGAVTFGLAELGEGAPAEAQTHTEAVQEKVREAAESGDPEKRRRVAREALAGKAALDVNPRGWLPVIVATAIIAALLLLGLTLAQAALVPLVAAQGNLRPSQAWAAVAHRFPALVRTGLLGAGVVAIGSVLLLVPGLIAALGLSFAIPATQHESVSGRAALERSWQLMRGRWLAVAGWWALILIFTAAGSIAAAALPAGLGRVAVASLIRVLLLPLPLVGLVTLYFQPQYIRRISEPG